MATIAVTAASGQRLNLLHRSLHFLLDAFLQRSARQDRGAQDG